MNCTSSGFPRAIPYSSAVPPELSVVFKDGWIGVQPVATYRDVHQDLLFKQRECWPRYQDVLVSFRPVRCATIRRSAAGAHGSARRSPRWCPWAHSSRPCHHQRPEQLQPTRRLPRLPRCRLRPCRPATVVGRQPTASPAPRQPVQLRTRPLPLALALRQAPCGCGRCRGRRRRSASCPRARCCCRVGVGVGDTADVRLAAGVFSSSQELLRRHRKQGPHTGTWSRR